MSLEKLLGRAVKRDEAHVLRFHRQDETKQTDKTKNKLESNVDFGLEARSAEDRHTYFPTHPFPEATLTFLMGRQPPSPLLLWASRHHVPLARNFLSSFSGPKSTNSSQSSLHPISSVRLPLPMPACFYLSFSFLHQSSTKLGITSQDSQMFHQCWP